MAHTCTQLSREFVLLCWMVAVAVLAEVGSVPYPPHGSVTESDRTTPLPTTRLGRRDPEEDMTPTQLITSKGYPCEDHYVTTDDGFILNMQRIPHGRNAPDSTETRPVVFLQHGLLGASTNFLTNLANESLAFILADSGCEVWLGNVRGNTYSRNHTSLKPSEAKFWAWSWDEMARYDLPKMLTHALSVTNQTQLYYVGHSQGTMIGFAEFSRNQELARKVKTFFALAPVTTVGDIKSPIRQLANYVDPIELLFDVLGTHEFSPSSDFMHFLGQDVCDQPVLDVVCENVLFLIGGFNYGNTNISRIPVYVSHSPAGTSVQNMVHYTQAVKDHKFQMYDYGLVENLLKYNQATPPKYYPENMTVPVALFTGEQDWLADPKDVATLLPRLKNKVYVKDIPEWQHLDFIWGMDAPQKCYKDIIDIIKKQKG
ncbi:gastric triacylglycerol lipase-like isoform X2 [Branchiostoma floridae]|uniref:Lipase n=1 Tax=Branchiostoma floridae TaxID=7739 RepID=A0A9J7KRM8_BRAFL|nr:gastric triacylglycerol lipase-like isoform X2 [Branchiostoma floridae]XP_035668790.1 gastric triacylglycerol lipase-like isoform X2 [Branchiostoma floridae]